MDEAARRRQVSGTISEERQERIASVGKSVDLVTEADLIDAASLLRFPEVTTGACRREPA